MPRTILLVPVFEAEPVVCDLRLRFDPPAMRHIPAHVTLMFPFLPELTDDVIDRLSELFAGCSPFDFVLTHAAVFPKGVLYLVPEPGEIFLRMTNSIADAFGTVPWHGEFDDVIPHLTVAQSVTDDSLATTFDAQLPISSISRRTGSGPQSAHVRTRH
ncbi:MAG: 2'-5' RNA ligase family protein [Actinomycetota bacterium]|nr:2'-5' RNA ligase family protein [Actinomycetota bacterium]